MTNKQLQSSLVGDDTWICDGMPVTPQMRHDILLQVAENFQLCHDFHYEWERDEFGHGGLVLSEDSPEHQTMGDFLGELSGESEDGYLSSNSYDLHDWLREYFLDIWDVTINQMEEEVDADWDGEWIAACKAIEWIEPMKCEEVMEWYEKQQSVEES